MDAHVEQYLTRVKGLKSEATHGKRTVDLRDFSEWVEGQGFESVTDLGVLDLENYFIHQRGQDYASGTINGRFQSVKGLYDFLTDKLEEYEDNPFDHLTRSEYVNGNGSRKADTAEIVYVTPEEKEKLVQHVPKPTLRNELLIRLLFQTGMRRGEVVGVELNDIDRDARAIRVWTPKTGESRTVYYQPSLDLLMDQWLDGGYRSSYPRADDSTKLFITSEGDLETNRVGRIIKKAAEDAGIQEVLYIDANGHERCRITAHSLRHGHAVAALKSGIDVRTVQKHLGHSTLDMTMTYLELIEDDVREGYRRFNPVPEKSNEQRIDVTY